MGWDIKPSGVQGVLNNVVDAADGLTKAVTDLPSVLMSTATSAGTIAPGEYDGYGHAVTGPGGPNGPLTSVRGIVAVALNDFVTANEQRLAYIATRTANSVKGAQDATNAYVRGDLEMAADAQKQALKEPVIDLPGVDGKKGGTAK